MTRRWAVTGPAVPAWWESGDEPPAWCGREHADVEACPCDWCCWVTAVLHDGPLLEVAA